MSLKLLMCFGFSVLLNQYTAVCLPYNNNVHNHSHSFIHWLFQAIICLLLFSFIVPLIQNKVYYNWYLYYLYIIFAHFGFSLEACMVLFCLLISHYLIIIHNMVNSEWTGSHIRLLLYSLLILLVWTFTTIVIRLPFICFVFQRRLL